MTRKYPMYTIDEKGRFKVIEKKIPNTFIQIKDCENHIKVRVLSGFNLSAFVNKVKYI